MSTTRRVPSLIPTLALAALACAVLAGCAGGPASTSPSGTTSGPQPSGAAASYLLASPSPAPPIELADSSGAAFSLASLRGHPVLLSFGYTHCPDVCPATVGIVSQAITALAPEARAVFVTIDPERDTTAALAAYVKYLAAGYQAVTGTTDQIRATANAWGIQYARVETGAPGDYSMSHTADVFLVDPAGLLRARFPFGTQSGAMVAVVRQVLASPVSTAVAASTSPAPAGTPAASGTPVPGSPGATTTPSPEEELGVAVVSSAIWAGAGSPLILQLSGPDGPLDDAGATVGVQLETPGDAVVGAPVSAVAVRPPGETKVFYVATIAPPTTGWWRVAVTATTGGTSRAGSADVAVLDPGSSAAIGTAAPSVHTPTLSDVGGDATAVTTDPLPDLRLYRTSTTDALAAHRPFVLVIDSTRFRTTSACGKALVMVRYLVDRWPQTAFIHLEPFRYDVVTDTPVLEGSIEDPTLVDAAAGWGIGAAPWSATSMPWVFVVDGNGMVRAKYQGVIGSDDVDVILSLIAQGG